VDERNSIFGMWACPAGFYAKIIDDGIAVTGAKTRDEACTKCEAGYYCEGAARPKS
jgi:DNA polymerase III alpha subunit (gram-positive type)